MKCICISLWYADIKQTGYYHGYLVDSLTMTGIGSDVLSFPVTQCIKTMSTAWVTEL